MSVNSSVAGLVGAPAGSQITAINPNGGDGARVFMSEDAKQAGPSTANGPQPAMAKKYNHLVAGQLRKALDEPSPSAKGPLSSREKKMVEGMIRLIRAGRITPYLHSKLTALSPKLRGHLTAQMIDALNPQPRPGKKTKNIKEYAVTGDKTKKLLTITEGSEPVQTMLSEAHGQATGPTKPDREKLKTIAAFMMPTYYDDKPAPSGPQSKNGTEENGTSGTPVPRTAQTMKLGYGLAYQMD